MNFIKTFFTDLRLNVYECYQKRYYSLISNATEDDIIWAKVRKLVFRVLEIVVTQSPT